MATIQASVLNNLQLVGLFVGAISGVMMMRADTFGLKTRIEALLPVMDTETIVNAIGAIVMGFVGFYVGDILKEQLGGRGAFNSSTYESYDKLLPDDYYGMNSQRQSSPIDFANNPLR